VKLLDRLPLPKGELQEKVSVQPSNPADSRCRIAPCWASRGSRTATIPGVPIRWAAGQQNGEASARTPCPCGDQRA